MRRRISSSMAVAGAPAGVVTHPSWPVYLGTRRRGRLCTRGARHRGLCRLRRVSCAVFVASRHPPRRSAARGGGDGFGPPWSHGRPKATTGHCNDVEGLPAPHQRSPMLHSHHCGASAYRISPRWQALRVVARSCRVTGGAEPYAASPKGLRIAMPSALPTRSIGLFR